MKQYPSIKGGVLNCTPQYLHYILPLVPSKGRFMRKCDYGCDQPANHQFKNGAHCCSKSSNSCPAKRAKVSSTKRGLQPPTDWSAWIDLTCESCGKAYVRRRSYLEARRRSDKPDTCCSCSNRLAAKDKWAGFSDETKAHIRERGREGVIAYCQSLSSEERQERSRKAGAANTSLSVIRQWESIKSDPAKMEAMRQQRSRTSKQLWDNYTPGERSARIKAMLGNRKVSKTGNHFLDQVEDAGKAIEREVPINGFLVDGLHEPSKTIIEFHGDFWHCNPKTHLDPDQYCQWLGRTVKQQWARDRKRLGVFYSKGYRVVIVWESDWVSDPEAQVQRVLKTIETGDYR